MNRNIVKWINNRIRELLIFCLIKIPNLTFTIFIGIIIFGVVEIFIIFGESYNIKQIKDCHKFTIGNLISNDRTLKNREIDFEYFVNGYRYTGISKSYPFQIPIKQILVLYPCADPSFSQMMLTPEDFKEYNLPYPDSLKWILPYIENK